MRRRAWGVAAISKISGCDRRSCASAMENPEQPPLSTKAQRITLFPEAHPGFWCTAASPEQLLKVRGVAPLLLRENLQQIVSFTNNVNAPTARVVTRSPAVFDSLLRKSCHFEPNPASFVALKSGPSKRDVSGSQITLSAANYAIREYAQTPAFGSPAPGRVFYLLLQFHEDFVYIA